MVKTILGEAFEQLGQIPKQVVKQVAKLPVDVIKTAVGKGGKRIDPLTGIEIPTPQKIKKLKKKEERKKTAGLTQARQVVTQATPVPQAPPYIAGKPGFGQEKKPGLPPPVSASKPKMGTGERKIMGSSG